MHEMVTFDGGDVCLCFFHAFWSVCMGRGGGGGGA